MFALVVAGLLVTQPGRLPCHDHHDQLDHHGHGPVRRSSAPVYPPVRSGSPLV